MKVCTGGCDPKPKPLTEYFTHPDGHVLHKCRACMYEAARQRRQNNLELHRAYDRMRYRRQRARLKQTTTTETFHATDRP